ncbi:MAG TPA: DUF92 domain-containing protein [Candidatus Thermoplasmatota archaeon]|nr:DUF92 domain-containing protein [Candidatus Thermoplasmatota archaeon]
MALEAYLTWWKLAQLLIVAAVAIYTFRKEMLNGTGAATAFVMGAVIVIATDIFWLFLLFALLGLGSAATKFKFKEKESIKVAEKGGGKRRSRNVIANGGIPMLIAALAVVADTFGGITVIAVTYTCAIAAASADTLASEFGSLAKKVRMITTLKRVPPGTDGGVSLQGQMAAAGGALVISLLSLLFLGLLSGDLPVAPPSLAVTLIPVVAGFFGCQVDSLVGATLETRGLVTKEEVNAIGIASGAALGLALVLLFGA